MKNLFSVNVKTNEVRGEEFVIRRPVSDLSRKSEEAIQTLSAYKKKGAMPLWYNLIMYAFVLASVICIPAFLEGCLDNGFEITYQRGSWALYIGGAGLILGFTMYIIKRVRLTKLVHNPEVVDFVSDMDKLTDRIRESLHVPENCADIDVFSRPYKMKNGKEKQYSHFFAYFNLSFWVFKEDDLLCFACAEGVYGIPVSSITEIVLNKKTVSVPQWNKDEPIKNEKYKPYVKTNNNGMYFIKKHYSIRFMRRGEEWEILIPAYDIDVITELTGHYPTV